jgi:RimJ/RimL family protein N-acetyltransferase
MLMNIEFEELTHENFYEASEINEDDVPSQYIDTVEELMDFTDYSLEHHYPGHTYLVKSDGVCVGIILLREAIPLETDPPQVWQEPFYRLMGFVIDKKYRDKGIGGEALEKAIECVYRDFGIRSIVLGCHKDNRRAAAFYEKHGFVKTEYMRDDDYYYLCLLNK